MGQNSFSGRIVHHEELSKLHHLHEEVRSVRKQLEADADKVTTGTEPIADTYSFSPDGELLSTDTASQDYIIGAINRTFGHNFKGDENEPKTYFGSGYKARGRTQREIRREIDRLRRFESVVKKTIQEVETNA